jgi:hypothetical protein
MRALVQRWEMKRTLAAGAYQRWLEDEAPLWVPVTNKSQSGTKYRYIHRGSHGVQEMGQRKPDEDDCQGRAGDSP